MFMNNKKKLCALFSSLVLFVNAETLAASNCLQSPISPTDWAQYGNGGGPCKVSSGYKWRQISLDGGKWVFHHGIDYACKVGTPIYAAIDGVAYHDTSVDAGSHVVRQISPGLNSRLNKNIKINYYHNSAWMAPHGATVTAGDPIAKVGNEGRRTTGPHLHFEVAETSRSTFVAGSYSSEKLGARGVCDNRRDNADGSVSCSNMRSIDPNTLMCPGYPNYSPIDGLDPNAGAGAPIPQSEDSNGTSVFSSQQPGEIPPPAPSGLGEESTRGNLESDIRSRAANPEYIKNLATLSDVSLMRELQYIESLSARILLLKSASVQRKESINAGILSLRTQFLKNKIEKQKEKSSGK